MKVKSLASDGLLRVGSAKANSKASRDTNTKREIIKQTRIWQSQDEKMAGSSLKSGQNSSANPEEKKAEKREEEKEEARAQVKADLPLTFAEPLNKLVD